MTSAALCALDSDSDEPFRSPLNGIIRSVPPRLNPELEKFVVCAADGHKMSPSTKERRPFFLENATIRGRGARYELMRDVLDVLDDFSVEHWLMAGTLLGAVRHGGIIPWDDDVDVAVGPLDSPRLGDVCAALKAPWRSEATWFGYKLFRGDAHWPFVDLFTTQFDAATETVRYASPVARETWPDEWWRVDELYPLRPINFGAERRARLKPPSPNDCWPYLSRSFKDNWRTNARTPVWDHRRERWYDDAKRGAAAADVKLQRADAVCLGHRSLANVGTAVDDYPRPPPPPSDPPSMTTLLGRLTTGGPKPAAVGDKE